MIFVSSFHLLKCVPSFVFSANDLTGGMVRKKGDNVRKVSNISYAKVNIRALFNNTIITVTDNVGNAILQDSAGMHFKNAKKSTIHASQVAARSVARRAISFGIRSVDVMIVGIGSSRDIIVRTISNEGINVLSILLKVNIAFNGVRSPAAKKGS